MSESHDCGFSFERLVANVEKLGWHGLLVPADDEGPGFGYTVGIHKTFGHPEVVVVGLRQEVRHAILNEFAESVRNGKRFEDGPGYPGFIEGYHCRFRRVHQSYYDDYFGQAIRFYSGKDFPVTQCVYPDRAGFFPWEKGCNPRLSRQEQLLDRPWAFKDARNTRAFTTRQVLESGLPVVYVTHDTDGDWQFLCPTTERVGSDCKIICLGDAVALDPRLEELADLPLT